jgi:hypothetical protein
MTNSIPAPPEGSPTGYYFQQLEARRRSDPYCDKVLKALERTCSHFNTDSVSIKEAILRLFVLSAPMTAKDAETEMLLKMLDHFKVEMEKE